jgi:hypothetical protein
VPVVYADVDIDTDIVQRPLSSFSGMQALGLPVHLIRKTMNDKGWKRDDRRKKRRERTEINTSVGAP